MNPQQPHLFPFFTTPLTTHSNPHPHESEAKEQAAKFMMTLSGQMGGPIKQEERQLAVHSGFATPTSSQGRSLGKHLPSRSESGPAPKMARVDQQHTTTETDGSEEEEEECGSSDDDEEEGAPDSENKENAAHVQTPTGFGMNPLAHSTPVMPTWTPEQQQLAAHYFKNYAMAGGHQGADVNYYSTHLLPYSFGGYNTDMTAGSANQLSRMGMSGSSSSGVHTNSFSPEQDPLATPNIFNFYQVNQPTGQMPPSNYEPFCTVPGRLTLLSNIKKYRVTMGEIQRRISPPECLNASILGGILRKAKNKDGGRVLRDALKQHGLTLPSGRRKSAATTSFTSLVEEETAQLARDFDEISKCHYPFQAAATYTLDGTRTANEAHERRLELFYARKFLRRLMEFHQSDRSPLGDQRLEMVLEPDLQKGLTNYSMVALDVLDNCITESSDILDLEHPPSSGPNFHQQAKP